MSVRIKYDVPSEYVKPKLEDLSVQTITLKEYSLPKSIPSTKSPVTKKDEEDKNKDNWQNWTITLSLDGIDTTVKGAEKFFKTLDKISATITQLLKIIRLLSGNVNSTSGFIKFAIKQLAKEIKEFIDSLTSTGLYMSLIVPDFDKKFPKYNIPIFGGYQEFITRVNSTCLSSHDPDAPKFEDSDKVGGVIIAMLGGVDDPDYLRNLLDNFKKLSNLFGFKIPYPAPARRVKATPGFYKKDGIKKLGVKLTWDASETPVGSFYVYRSDKQKGKPITVEVNGSNVNLNLFTDKDPIVKTKYIPGKATYSYIDFDVTPESLNFYKLYSVFGDDYLEEHPYLKAVNSPIATPTVMVNVPKECIPVSELKKYMNMSISGEILSPFDLEGDWQSMTVRRMLSNQIDDMYNALDVLTDKLIGLVNTSSTAINDYLKFYGERVGDLLEIIEKIKNLTARLSSFTQRGTFMVLDLPLETGGMRGFVDRFNKACNSGNNSKETSTSKKSLDDFLKGSLKVQKNSPIATFNERGIMFGVILLYGVPDINNADRLKEIVPEDRIEATKRQVTQTQKAISTFLKMLGLDR